MTMRLTEGEKLLKTRCGELVKANAGLTEKLREYESRLNERARSAGAMRDMMMRERYEALLIKQERDALRKVVIVLVEAGRFPEPSQPIAAAWDGDTKNWKIDVSQSVDSL